MGISCSILFKKASYHSALEIYKEMEKVCQYNKYYCEVSQKEVNEQGIITKIYFNVSDRPFENFVSRQLAISLFDESFDCAEHQFNWYGEEGFFETMYIDFFEDNEDLLLELLYGFMKKYKDAVIWIEQDWFYFYEDIIKIKQAPFNSLWCYKNPHS